VVIRRSAFAALAFGLLISSTARAAEQLSSFTVPVSVIDGYVIVDVRLNGEGPFHFMFDTGADLVILDPVAQKLALKVEDWGDSFGDGENKVHLRRAELRDVQIGELHSADRIVGVAPSDDVRQVFGTYPLSGFIGKSLLKGMVVKLDYVHRQLTFTPAAQFSYSGTGTSLPFIDGHIVATIDGIQQAVYVDTGTNPGLIIGAFTSTEHDLPSKYKASVQSVTDWGFGGPVRTQLARGHLFELGNIEVRDPLLYLSVQKVGLLASADAHLGGGVLSQFDVTFDPSRERVILEKNANIDRPEAYDRVGMWMGQAGQYFTVADVAAGGPADLAGVKTGDTILKIDGTSTANLVLPTARERMERRSAGDQIRLLLQSGDTRRVVVVTLQDRV
jgi:hypothetical protein